MTTEYGVTEPKNTCAGHEIKRVIEGSGGTLEVRELEQARDARQVT